MGLEVLNIKLGEKKQTRVSSEGGICKWVRVHNLAANTGTVYVGPKNSTEEATIKAGYPLVKGTAETFIVSDAGSLYLEGTKDDNIRVAIYR